MTLTIEVAPNFHTYCTDYTICVDGSPVGRASIGRQDVENCENAEAVFALAHQRLLAAVAEQAHRDELDRLFEARLAALREQVAEWRADPDTQRAVREIIALNRPYLD